MNLLLFEAQRSSYRLMRTDERARHIVDVLNMGVGDTLFVGVAQGCRGQAKIVCLNEESIELTVSWDTEVKPLWPISLFVGLPRPQTARKVLQACSTLGVAQLHFFMGEKSDPAYGQSRLWHSGEWERHLRLGAEQACETLLPEVVHRPSLVAAMEAVGESDDCIALDIYESSASLSQCIRGDGRVVLAIGPERGWSAGERDYLRQAGFAVGDLGSRVLRTEHACVAAVSVVLAGRGVF